MKGTIRSIVGIPKNSYRDDDIGVKFDMSYITPRIIVGAGPVNNNLKKWYRYPVEDLVKILKFKHGKNWHLWNLRGERMGYDPDDVAGKVSYYPFPDHQAPPFELVVEIVDDIYNFLQADENNVAVIHCKAGKGRSGTVCCALLMYIGHIEGHRSSSSDVNVYYTSKRMKEGVGKGVSIKSQLLYLDYFGRYLDLPAKAQNQVRDIISFANPHEVMFEVITITNVVTYMASANKCRISLEGYRPISGKNDCKRGAITESLWELSQTEGITTSNTVTFKLQRSFKHYSDFKLTINNVSYCWFNVAFGDKSLTTFKFEDIDGFKGTNQVGAKLFDLIVISWRVKSSV